MNWKKLQYSKFFKGNQHHFSIICHGDLSSCKKATRNTVSCAVGAFTRGDALRVGGTVHLRQSPLSVTRFCAVLRDVYLRFCITQNRRYSACKALENKKKHKELYNPLAREPKALDINTTKVPFKQTNKKIITTFFNQCFDKNRLKNFVLWFLLQYGEHKSLQLVEQLKNIGFKYASKAGISLGIDDLRVPPKKGELIYEAEKQTYLTLNQYNRGEITGVERFQRLIDTWHRTSETLKQEVINHFEATDILNPVYMMAFSGARGNISQVRQLVGMRGLMADPQGQILDFPIRSNFREGLTLTEYIISSYGARKGIVDTALRTANAGYLTRRLVDVAQHVIISNFDCGTRRGIYLTNMKEGNKTIITLTQRLVGRILARDLTKARQLPSSQALGRLISLAREPRDSVLSLEARTIKTPTGANQRSEALETQVLYKRNEEITLDLAFEIGVSLKFEKVFVRSPLTCETPKLICQLCYGWSLAQGNLVSIGEAVGVVAAQSIGEPGTQLTMRTFHTGGVFSGDVSDQIRAPFDGFIEYVSAIPGTLIRTPEGKIAFLTKAEGSFWVHKKEKVNGSKKYKISPYTLLYKRNAQTIFEKEVIAQISSISQKSNATDDAALTIKSENEGQFYSKSLGFYERLIGPERGGDRYVPNNERDGESDKVYEAWTWGYAWVLSGKIYELKIPSPLFPKLGDYVNTKSTMSETKWKFHNINGQNYSVRLNLSLNQKETLRVTSPVHLTAPNGARDQGRVQMPNQEMSRDPILFTTQKKVCFDLAHIFFKKNGYILQLSHLYQNKGATQVSHARTSSRAPKALERYGASTEAHHFSSLAREPKALARFALLASLAREPKALAHSAQQEKRDKALALRFAHSSLFSLAREPKALARDESARDEGAMHAPLVQPHLLGLCCSQVTPKGVTRRKRTEGPLTMRNASCVPKGCVPLGASVSTRSTSPLQGDYIFLDLAYNKHIKQRNQKNKGENPSLNLSSVWGLKRERCVLSSDLLRTEGARVALALARSATQALAPKALAQDAQRTREREPNTDHNLMFLKNSLILQWFPTHTNTLTGGYAFFETTLESLLCGLRFKGVQAPKPARYARPQPPTLASRATKALERYGARSALSPSASLAPTVLVALSPSASRYALAPTVLAKQRDIAFSNLSSTALAPSALAFGASRSQDSSESEFVAHYNALQKQRDGDLHNAGHLKAYAQARPVDDAQNRAMSSLNSSMSLRLFWIPTDFFTVSHISDFCGCATLAQMRQHSKALNQKQAKKATLKYVFSNNIKDWLGKLQTNRQGSYKMVYPSLFQYRREPMIRHPLKDSKKALSRFTSLHHWFDPMVISPIKYNNTRDFMYFFLQRDSVLERSQEKRDKALAVRRRRNSSTEGASASVSAVSEAHTRNASARDKETLLSSPQGQWLSLHSRDASTVGASSVKDNVILRCAHSWYEPKTVHRKIRTREIRSLPFLKNERKNDFLKYNKMAFLSFTNLVSNDRAKGSQRAPINLEAPLTGNSSLVISNYLTKEYNNFSSIKNKEKFGLFCKSFLNSSLFKPFSQCTVFANGVPQLRGSFASSYLNIVGTLKKGWILVPTSLGLSQEVLAPPAYTHTKLAPSVLSSERTEGAREIENEGNTSLLIFHKKIFCPGQRISNSLNFHAPVPLLTECIILKEIFNIQEFSINSLLKVIKTNKMLFEPYINNNQIWNSEHSVKMKPNVSSLYLDKCNADSQSTSVLSRCERSSHASAFGARENASAWIKNDKSRFYFENFALPLGHCACSPMASLAPCARDEGARDTVLVARGLRIYHSLGVRDLGKGALASKPLPVRYARPQSPSAQKERLALILQPITEHYQNNKVFLKKYVYEHITTKMTNNVPKRLTDLYCLPGELSKLKRNQYHASCAYVKRVSCVPSHRRLYLAPVGVFIHTGAMASLASISAKRNARALVPKVLEKCKSHLSSCAPKAQLMRFLAPSVLAHSATPSANSSVSAVSEAHTRNASKRLGTKGTSLAPSALASFARATSTVGASDAEGESNSSVLSRCERSSHARENASAINKAKTYLVNPSYNSLLKWILFKTQEYNKQKKTFSPLALNPKHDAFIIPNHLFKDLSLSSLAPKGTSPRKKETKHIYSLNYDTSKFFKKSLNYSSFLMVLSNRDESCMGDISVSHSTKPMHVALSPYELAQTKHSTSLRRASSTVGASALLAPTVLATANSSERTEGASEGSLFSSHTMSTPLKGLTRDEKQTYSFSYQPFSKFDFLLYPFLFLPSLLQPHSTPSHSTPYLGCGAIAPMDNREKSRSINGMHLYAKFKHLIPQLFENPCFSWDLISRLDSSFLKQTKISTEIHGIKPNALCVLAPSVALGHLISLTPKGASTPPSGCLAPLGTSFRPWGSHEARAQRQHETKTAHHTFCNEGVAPLARRTTFDSTSNTVTQSFVQRKVHLMRSHLSSLALSAHECAKRNASAFGAREMKAQENQRRKHKAANKEATRYTPYFKRYKYLDNTKCYQDIVNDRSDYVTSRNTVSSSDPYHFLSKPFKGSIFSFNNIQKTTTFYSMSTYSFLPRAQATGTEFKTSTELAKTTNYSPFNGEIVYVKLKESPYFLPALALGRALGQARRMRAIDNPSSFSCMVLTKLDLISYYLPSFNLQESHLVRDSLRVASPSHYNTREVLQSTTFANGCVLAPLDAREISRPSATPLGDVNPCNTLDNSSESLVLTTAQNNAAPLGGLNAPFVQVQPFSSASAYGARVASEARTPETLAQEEMCTQDNKYIIKDIFIKFGRMNQESSSQEIPRQGWVGDKISNREQIKISKLVAGFPEHNRQKGFPMNFVTQQLVSSNFGASASVSAKRNARGARSATLRFSLAPSALAFWVRGQSPQGEEPHKQNIGETTNIYNKSSSLLGDFLVYGDEIKHYNNKEGPVKLFTFQNKSGLLHPSSPKGISDTQCRGPLAPSAHEMPPTQAVQTSGQIIHYNNDKITLRRSQPIFISPKAILHKFDGDFVNPKAPVITLSYKQLKTGDIIQGIPKVEQFFEARTTKRGHLFRDSLPSLLKGLFKRFLVFLPLDLAVRQSIYKIQQIIVDGVLRVYKSQGVTIADKHLEVIVKQMTGKVRILDGAQTGFFPGEVLDLCFVEKINRFLIKKVTYEPLVLGITKASLEVESFLSAASFQQTTRVLSQAALYRKKDFLKGLKENVILGNLIPAGTGYLVFLDDVTPSL